jgi:hypothetical protein
VDDANRLDLVSRILGQPRLDLVRVRAPPPVTGSRQSPGMNSGSSRKRSASSCHSVANCPVSDISTRSPADSVLTSAASHAPVPEDGKMKTSASVLNTRFMPSSTSRPSSPKPGPRWSMVGLSMARRIRSGTLLGPGI